MDEVRALPWNGLRVASFFAGGGGSSTGYRMAGYRVAYANEFVEAARETYAANKAEYTVLDGRDIRQVTPESVMEAIGIGPGELDVLDGSPPCASFSMAGKREKGWGEVKQYSDTEQRSDDLFFEFARILRGVRPRAFVAENVAGLVRGTARGYFKEIHAALAEAGYRVEARVLNAMWLGVPQSRERTIFIGIRSDLGVDPVFPRPLPYYYSISDAIPHVRGVGGIRDTGFSGGSIVGANEPCPTIMAGGGNGMNQSQFGVVADVVEPEADISRFAIGAEWSRLQPGEQSDRYFQLVRPDPAAPVGTITASGGSGSIAGVTHPYEKRKFTIAELKRLGGFPDDYVLTGSYQKQWERIGRAVPPVMMSHIAAAVRDTLRGA